MLFRTTTAGQLFDPQLSIELEPDEMVEEDGELIFPRIYFKAGQLADIGSPIPKVRSARPPRSRC
jgi:hypothetical protein